MVSGPQVLLPVDVDARILTRSCWKVSAVTRFRSPGLFCGRRMGVGVGWVGDGCNYLQYTRRLEPFAIDGCRNAAALHWLSTRWGQLPGRGWLGSAMAREILTRTGAVEGLVGAAQPRGQDRADPAGSDLRVHGFAAEGLAFDAGYGVDHPLWTGADAAAAHPVVSVVCVSGVVEGAQPADPDVPADGAGAAGDVCDPDGHCELSDRWAVRD